MGNLLTCFFTIFKRHNIPNCSQKLGKVMENLLMEVPTESMINDSDSLPSQQTSTEVDTERSSHNSNIIENNNFAHGLHSWNANCCDAFLVLSAVDENTTNSCRHHVVVTNRTQNWQGLEQDITSKISKGSTYSVFARVGVSGSRLTGKDDVIATLKLEYQHSCTKYLNITRTTICKEKWENLDGTFVLSDKPDRVVLYFEGPAPGVNILIESVSVFCHGKAAPCGYTEDGNIILNPEFEDGVNNWSGRGCKIGVHDSMGDGKILPKSGKFFASTEGRTQSWNGIQQDITGKVQRKLAYEISAFVRIFGNNITSSGIRATLWVQTPDSREQYIGIANAQATDSDWVQLQGKFLLNGLQSKVVIYLEGPPSGTDILLDGLIVKHAEKLPPSPPPVIESPDYGVNIITNSNLSDGTNVFFPLGSCSLNVTTGSPHVLPPDARDTLGPHEPLSGRCINTTNRTQTWMGPAQMITDKVKLYVTYQVSAWVRLGPGATGPQNVNVALGVDSQWVNGGQVEIYDSDRWHEICGSFRIEKQPAKVMVYVQGPEAGISFMLAGLQIFAVDREARFRHLKRQTDMIRKRDVTLKFTSPASSDMHVTTVIVKQSQNSFPIGTCISRSNIDNEDFVAFLVKNFNWAVFGNELKWYWTESQKGNLNYKDADDLLKLCDDNNISARGHCIFWDVDNTVQDWVKNLNKTDLASAVQNRLTSLLNRYKGKFKHYDVNNEMLHGSFYPNRLGQDTRANMFKTANQLDPSATLFVNDYHVEDGCDTRSSPEKYISQILDLQQQGAPVGGIGIQGHIDSPVGPIVCSALDKLGTLGLPIWFTELDVSSNNEHIRADDLEVMFREAFAHPAVEGIMIWGFWELFMSRDNSHLVNAEGDVNEAGNRLLKLKNEWLSHAHGHVDDQGEFKFRGFQGTYEVVVVADSKKTVKTFVVEKGDGPLVVSMDL
ncbi:endo-1,4-beta-xylanase 1-like [Rutidosis leptorrhynchoides]|uniref:endo-1,4-beta-xylanase 1-like n=1 Tax=Rutidosis leptorrhynchoides TaxID=125765 RepID=UPI003A9982B0